MKSDERIDLEQKVYALEVAVHALRDVLNDIGVSGKERDEALAAVDHAITELTRIK